MRMCELQEKEVINICDCKYLGRVMDLEFNECDGCIRAIIVPEPGKFPGCFTRERIFCIPWCRIVKIGPDVILVEIKDLKDVIDKENR